MGATTPVSIDPLRGTPADRERRQLSVMEAGMISVERAAELDNLARRLDEGAISSDDIQTAAEIIRDYVRLQSIGGRQKAEDIVRTLAEIQKQDGLVNKKNTRPL